MRRIGRLFMILVVSACSPTLQNCVPSSESEVVYIIERDWHAEIGIPVSELKGDLASYRNLFSGARVILFGYGKKTFFTAPPNTFSEYLLGPFPGPGAIQAVALNELPTKAYASSSVTVLALPPGGSENLSNFVWNDLAKNIDGKPVVLAPSTDPVGLFYAANSPYNPLHTCNTWVADALHAAGLEITSDNVIFAGQLMTRVDDVAEEQCH